MTTEAATTTEGRSPRGERSEGRRGQRTEREPRPAPVAEETQPAAQGFVDSLPEPQADAATDGGERDATRRRRRRGGRGRGRDEAGTDGTGAGQEDQAELAVDSAPIAADSVITDTRRVVEAQSAEPPPSIAPEVDGGPAPAQAPVMSAAPAAIVPAASATVALVEPTPIATPYLLPTDTLAAIASDAGLQWVNSDVEKIRAAQEAMANEPKPIHVPRQPKPRAVLDDGPLVLVETKKDLSQVRLPFDAGTPPAPL